MPTSTFAVEANKRQLLFMDWVLDLFLYTFILGLFVEYSHDFKIDSFTYIILTALVLKISLFIIQKLEHSITKFFKKFDGKAYKVLNVVIVFSILFGSKFVILEVLDILFGEHVEIHGFVALIVMILTMIISRKLLVVVYKKL